MIIRNGVGRDPFFIYTYEGEGKGSRSLSPREAGDIRTRRTSQSLLVVFTELSRARDWRSTCFVVCNESYENAAMYPVKQATNVCQMGNAADCVCLYRIATSMWLVVDGDTWNT